MNRLFNVFKKSITERTEYENPVKESYAQSGEDLIVKYIFTARGIEKPSYLDIGANHPLYLNNTYIFYKSGSRGVNIEPNQKMIDRFNNQRPEDKNLTYGVSSIEGELTYYILETPELNTFSKEHMEHMLTQGHQLLATSGIPVKKIDSIIENNFSECQDVIFIDVEGMDYELIASINFNKYQPKVFCVETTIYDRRGNTEKDERITDLLTSKGYMLYADTNINSIYVLKNFWILKN